MAMGDSDVSVTSRHPPPRETQNASDHLCRSRISLDAPLSRRRPSIQYFSLEIARLRHFVPTKNGYGEPNKLSGFNFQNVLLMMFVLKPFPHTPNWNNFISV